MVENTLLLRTVAGSHLYGYATPLSDFDFFEVYSTSFPPVGKKTAPILSRQTIVDGVDTVQMSLSHFIDVASSGSHQALDAMFANEPEIDLISALRAGFRAGYEVIPAYERIITKFALQDTPRKQRHALRAAFNLSDILKSGRYKPELDDERLQMIADIHVLPPHEFKEELIKLSPVGISHYFV